ncbi:MAG: hypothetical protein ACD_19C00234G0003, partial [uncultured bacterium]
LDLTSTSPESTAKQGIYEPRQIRYWQRNTLIKRINVNISSWPHGLGRGLYGWGK